MASLADVRAFRPHALAMEAIHYFASLPFQKGHNGLSVAVGTDRGAQEFHLWRSDCIRVIIVGLNRIRLDPLHTIDGFAGEWANGM